MFGLVMKLNNGGDSEARFGQDFEVEILKLKFGQYFAANVWLRLRS